MFGVTQATKCVIVVTKFRSHRLRCYGRLHRFPIVAYRQYGIVVVQIIRSHRQFYLAYLVVTRRVDDASPSASSGGTRQQYQFSRSLMRVRAERFHHLNIRDRSAGYDVAVDVDRLLDVAEVRMNGDVVECRRPNDESARRRLHRLHSFDAGVAEVCTSDDAQ